MEISNVQIQYDIEKLQVLGRYIKGEAELIEGLEDFIQTLYERYVPADVRKSIEQKKEGNTL